MSLSFPLLHRVIAEVHCEQKDCVDSAAWIVGLDKSVQFLCKEHTIECMSDTTFWRPQKGKRTSRTPAKP